MAVVLVYQPRVPNPAPLPWSGTAARLNLFSLSAFDNSGDAGNIFTGVRPYTWPPGRLSGLMHQVTGGTDYTADPAGAEPPGEGASPVGPLAWSTQVLSYPSDPDTTGFFYLYTFMAKLWHSGYYLTRPPLLAMRDHYAATLLDALPNPGGWGVEWEGNALGSWSAPTVHVAEQLGTSQRNDGRAGASRDTPALSGTSYLLNVSGERDFQHDSRTARLDDPGSGNVLLGSTPALSGELAQQEATYTPDAALFESAASNPYVGAVGVGDSFTFYAAPTGPMLDPTAWDYLTTQNVGIHQGLAANLTVSVTYTPPPYRLYQYLTITDQPPWLRALQRSDGLGAGGPPRAVQQAMQADSLRSGIAAT